MKRILMQKILHAKQSILLSSLLIVSTITQPFQTTAHEFYFVRHGQTDHNIGLNANLNDGLNKVGKHQTKKVTSLLAKLPIKTICSSPLLRIQETTEIINAKLKVPNFVIPELKEGESKV